MTLFIQDTFDEATEIFLDDHAPNIGGAWSAHPSLSSADSLKVAGESAGYVFRTGTQSPYYINATEAPNDFILEMQYKAPITGTTMPAGFGFLFRFSDSVTQGYRIQTSSSGWSTYKDGSGSIRSISGVSFVRGAIRTAAVLVIGSRFQLLLDGVSSLEIDDTTRTFSRVGFSLPQGVQLLSFAADDDVSLADKVFTKGPILAATTPFTVHDVPRTGKWSLPSVQDYYRTNFYGNGRIAGTVAEKGTPNTPVRRRVRLYQDRDGIFVRETWSDPVTGAYSFDYIDEKLTYTVLSYDHTGEFRAVVADRITPALMA